MHCEPKKSCEYPNSYIKKKGGLCGCCDECIVIKNEGEICNVVVNEMYPPKIMCAPVSLELIYLSNARVWLFDHLTPSLRVSTVDIVKSGIHRIQCIGASGRHPFWHGSSADRPRQYPGQASGGLLLKSHLRWLGESGQQPRLSPNALG
ncbi:uncharacterized protein TNCV_1842491 [Trichonephila clavipes]|nr:uncharacterized protein TNCV_1842491 [Trichonephila clavipes]